ncbi:MAG: hypothetical protein IKZ60_05775 [Bacteroidales bacterium]|nr:hypothetical protein [Bacteroidales bacterium]
MKRLAIILMTALVALVSCSKDDTNLEGRWNAPRSDEQPDDTAIALIFSGNKLDLYICSYGWHFEGTYTYADKTVKYNVTKAYSALTDVEIDERTGMIVAYSGGIESIDHNTLKPNAGYGWYDMLIYRPDLYEEYKDMLSSFTFEITGNGKAKSDVIGLMGSTFTKVK